MHRRNSVLSVVAALAMVVVMVACGATPTAQTTTAAPTASQPTKAGPTSTPQVVTKVVTATPAATSKTGGTFIWGVQSDPPGFNPILNDNDVDLYVINLGWQPLTWGGENYPTDLKPVLATSWETSADGKVWTIHLRPNVKWSDGVAFTADDVLFWAQALQDPKTNARYFRDRYYCGDVPHKFEKVDDVTVKITTDKSVPSLMNDISLPIIPAHYFQQNKVANADMATDKSNTEGAMPVIGAFKVTKYARGESVTLERNDNYWGGKPYLDKVVLRIIPDAQALVVALQNGEVDWTQVTPENASLIIDQPKVQPKILKEDSVLAIGVNTVRPLVKDKRTRQALMMALNRKAIIAGNALGYGELMEDIYSFVVTAYTKQTPDYAYNPDAAKALLATVGWKPGSDGVLVSSGVAGVPDGTRFHLTYIFYETDDKVPLLAQSMWKAIGVEVALQQMDLNTFKTAIHGTGDKPYELCRAGFGWMGSYAGAYSQPFAASDQPTNTYSYHNQQVSDLFAKAQAMKPGAEADVIYKQIGKLLWDDLPMLPLYTRNWVFGQSKKLHLEEVDVNPSLYAMFSMPDKIWKEK